MSKMAKEQRDFLKTCRKIWPDAEKEDKKKKISIVKSVDSRSIRTFERTVEEYVENQSSLISNKGGIQKSLSKFSRTGIIAGSQKVYEVKNEQGKVAGTITYTRTRHASLEYDALIELEGFDKRSSTYKRLVRDLETFARVEPNSYEWFRVMYPGKEGKPTADMFFNIFWEREMKEGQRQEK